MKVATWNVNGIRARQSQLQEWIEREQPDIVCLQEIKASLDQLPVWICELDGYWCYWHGAKGYSGVALHVRKTAASERRQGFSGEDAVSGGARALRGRTRRRRTSNGVVRRLEHRARRHRRPPERAKAAGDRTASRRAGAAGADHQPRSRRHGSRARARQRSALHVVGTVAEPARAEHRVAARLRARQPGDFRPGRRL